MSIKAKLFDIAVFNCEGELKADTLTKIEVHTTINGIEVFCGTATGLFIKEIHIIKIVGNLKDIKEELESNEVTNVSDKGGNNEDRI